jgi:hypothetical protein
VIERSGHGAAQRVDDVQARARGQAGRIAVRDVDARTEEPQRAWRSRARRRRAPPDRDTSAGSAAPARESPRRSGTCSRRVAPATLRVASCRSPRSRCAARCSSSVPNGVSRPAPAFGA